ncbi:TlpA family protein disulfide reductase [Alkalibacillus silvisoli]|uniref:Thioredoxin domain-containing protein n=1 Tax=Alkalibacillus silvisoli TaxID=392823 RepID=A0ABN1A8Y3_9BACI
MDQILLYSNVMLWALQIIILISLFLMFKQFGEVYLKSGDSISRDGIPEGQKVPSLTGISNYSNEIVTREPNQDKPTLLAFISSDCEACKSLYSDWNRMHLKFKDSVDFILIAETKNEEKFEELIEKENLQGEIILDSEKDILRDLDVRVTPFAYALDTEGVVKAKGLCNGENHIKSLLFSLDIEGVQHYRIPLNVQKEEKGEKINA